MGQIELLVQRYVEDSASLADNEFDELVAALRADPELAASVQEQLWLDDLLSQKLTVDRQNFVAQVEQRIADVQRGSDALHQQVADLSSMAAAEKVSTRRTTGFRQAFTYVVALCALVLVGAFIYLVQFGQQHEPTVATVLEFDGSVTVGEGNDAEAVEVNSPVEHGQHVVVPQGGSVTLAYGERTKLQLKGNSEITVGTEQPGETKTIRIDRGEVVVQIRPPATEKVQFATPHASAIASEGLLRLVVTDESTLLDVSEGQVRFDRLADKRSILVAANESGLASRDTLQIRQLMWPDRRDGLAYLLTPLETHDDGKKPLVVARNPETRHLQLTALEPRGDATMLDSRLCLELNGGYLISQDAGPDIFHASRGGSELTMEAIFCPANLSQAGPARIVALADDSDEADFALAQDGCDVMFSLRTDAAPSPPAPPRLTINTPDTTLHMTVTYRHAELIVYRDGIEIARSKDLWGSLASWRSGPLTIGADAGGERPWRGIVEAFALYNRCLEPGEVARNARNYRLLAGRGM